MHTIRGQALPASFLEHPYDKKNASESGSASNRSSVIMHPSPADQEAKDAKSSKDKGEKHSRTKDKSFDSNKDIRSLVSASMMTTTAFLGPPKGRERSGSAASQRSSRSNQESVPVAPQFVRRNSAGNEAHPSLGFVSPGPALPQQTRALAATGQQQPHHHHHIRLPSFLKRRKQTSIVSAATLDSTSLLSSSSSSSFSSSFSTLPHPSSSTLETASVHYQQQQQYTILMVPQHDIHITWPHSVSSGNAYIAGTWSVPGHGPWEKLPMSLIPGTDSHYEVHLNVQEVEDISDYLDEEGYLHHELLDHHAHDSSFQEHQQPISTPSSPSTSGPSTPALASLSKRQRLRRIFGRSRSSSSASASSKHEAAVHQGKPKDFHVDLPYHHQSKDGIILPLTKEYRYQYKFVIDDEWKCDPQRHQVQDDQGHWNHELVVDLIEQIQLPTSANRSRSSSLQSQHSVSAFHSSTESTASFPLISSYDKDQDKALTEVISKGVFSEDTKDKDIPSLAPAAVSSHPMDDTVALVPSLLLTPTPTSTSTPPLASSLELPGQAKDNDDGLPSTRGKKSKDTYEAILIFDETDDLSDGEGRSRRKDDNVDRDTESDDDIQVEEIVGHDVPAEGHSFAPQQDQQQQPQHEHDMHTTMPAVVHDEHVDHDQFAIEAHTLPVVTPHALGMNVGQEAPSLISVPLDDVVVNPSSVAEPLPMIGEQSIIATPCHEDYPNKCTDISIENTPVESVSLVIETEEEQSEHQASEVVQDPETKASSEEPFALQAAAISSDETFTSPAPALSRHGSSKGSRAPLEVITDPTVATGATGAAASYSQVPSPPLTPSNPTAIRSDSNTQDNTDSDNEYVENAQQQQEGETFMRSVLLTPRSEAPSHKLTARIQVSSPEQPTKADDDNDTFDVLGERQPSILSSSLPLSSPLPTCHRNDSGDQSITAPQDKKRVSEEYSNLLWSICKTTAVVSAAVVVIGLGFGRKKG
ncbi:hypothetical protein EDD11_001669 [Mortierella claussenii]|nr:hypothetical protein EDD11_001669 [Mortierella claussenii]